MDSLFDQGTASACPAPFNLAAHVLAAGHATPDKIALSILGLAGAERWSYARLTKAVLGTASGLLAKGAQPGDTILMRIGNSVDFPILYLGAIAAGLVPVPTSSHLTERETNAVLKHLSPRFVVQADGVSCPPTDTPVIDQLTFRTWRDLAPAAFDMGAPDRLAYIVYTSGTSGVPRAVGHAHRAIWARQMMLNGWYGLTSKDRLMHAGAFNWTFTLGTGLLDPWSVGATALIPQTGITPAQMGLLMARNDATLFAAAPGIYRQMLRSPVPTMPKLRHGLAAGEKLSDQIRNEWQTATHTPIYEAFGMSECSTFISASPNHPARDGTLGRPQDGRRIAIVDDQGTPVPIEHPGIIAVHRSDPGLMLGYVGAQSATLEKFRGDWFLTGDRASMSAQGDITFWGRSDDMMNAGGFRVSPLEVEAALADIPGIKEIAVTEVTVKRDVRVIAAFYLGPKDLDPSYLKAEAAERLADYKCPRAFTRLDSLPRNPNGKLLRSALRKLAI